MKSTPWPSISSFVRCAPVAGLSSSSRKSTSTLRPMTPPRALSSSTASSAPRFWSAAMAAKGPVRGSGNPILIGPEPWGLTWRNQCGPASRFAVAAPVVVKKPRRVRLVIVEPPEIFHVLRLGCPDFGRNQPQGREPDLTNVEGTRLFLCELRNDTAIVSHSLRGPFLLDHSPWTWQVRRDIFSTSLLQNSRFPHLRQ